VNGEGRYEATTGDRVHTSSVGMNEGPRPVARGKFLFVGEEKLYIRGVTYGTFRPNEREEDLHDREQVDRDFAQMAATGINAVRVYTVPPRWLLDCAQRHGLRVMVGLPWEQHITFLDDERRARDIVERVRQGVRSCAGHPAVLCYAVGNEIPASIVRWHGARAVESFLRRLYHAARDEDPGGLVTYVNFPTTEYLDLSFLDFLCFNVYLESREQLEPYLAHLQVIAGDRPLVMAEIGLDSRRNGEQEQARVLAWQLESIFRGGAAGAFVFAWTDEWHRGGFDVDDWDFGLTDRQRRPKPALAVVSDAFSRLPFVPQTDQPRVSVVVCTHNGARTLRDCCEGLTRLDYPDYEVVVVDDGSSDGSAVLAQSFGFRVISTENRGLSSARNLGWQASSGEIVAYIDDDAYPDPHWLTYLVPMFAEGFVGVGGPNIAPAGDGLIADCVANAPGGPVHVLLGDRDAEHIPGCNMAFLRAALEAVGGFDPRYRAAGDDVDICWRLQERGWKLGFSPAAMVWHHRRNSIRAYWRQQKGYGKAEALLEEKWPERYNGAGHVAWTGRLYGKGLTLPLPFRRGRIYQGEWGTAPFQSMYEPRPGTLHYLPLMPEWYLVAFLLLLLSALGTLWHPLLLALPLLAIALGAPVVQAALSAARASFSSRTRAGEPRAALYALTAFLHVLQPLARLWGRIRYGLTPWRVRTRTRLSVPRTRVLEVWSEEWKSTEAWLTHLEALLQMAGAPVSRGGGFDRWDLEVRPGVLGTVRMSMAVEEHGGGKQLARFRIQPRISPGLRTLILLFMIFAAGAGLGGSWIAMLILSLAAALLAARGIYDCAAAVGVSLAALQDPESLPLSEWCSAGSSSQGTRWTESAPSGSMVGRRRN